MAPQRLDEFPRSELTATIAVHHDSLRVAAVGDGHLECVHGDAGLHPGVDRVADDLVREHVLDRAEVELPLRGPVLGDVGQPQLVRAIGGEVALHEVVVHR